jgi:hypothetical protein
MIMDLVSSCTDAALVCYFMNPDSLTNHSSEEARELGKQIGERMEALNGGDAGTPPNPPVFLDNTLPPGRWELIVPPGAAPGAQIEVQFPGRSRDRDVRTAIVTVPMDKKPGDMFVVGEVKTMFAQQPVVAVPV